MLSWLTEGPSLLPWLVILPLLWSILSLTAGQRLQPLIATTAVGLILLATLLVLLQWLQRGDHFYSLGDWAVPLGIRLRLDGLALLLLLLTSGITSVCTLHAGRYLQEYPRAKTYFWPLLAFCWAAMNVIWLSADLFNLYVGLELLGFSAVGLVALTGEKKALAASLRYLYAALLGSLAWLLGVALIYGHQGQLDISSLALTFTDSISGQAALALMTLGLLLKMAAFPLHSWLPPAHASALPPVSALLSGLVAKAAFYILVRLWLEMAPDNLTFSAAQLLGALGAAAVFWGGWMACRQQQLKMLVAYSTVAQLGYLLLLFPLTTGTGEEATRLAWEGGWLQLTSHALAKAAMFLAAGNLVLAMGRPDLPGLHGAGRYLPFSLLGFGLAGVSLMGLPPSGGFMAKWLLLQSALLSGQWWWILVLLSGSALSAVYIFKVYQQCYVESDNPDRFRQPALVLDLSALALALLALALGILSAWPQWLISTALPGGAA
ncbi:complex I subunit 5 family protein [Marinospirillum alkaliphilum]|uniref:Formate hydrogenlyase subunit 3/Multisubunit Na+/H+ antiporter, MnhD subunit n=1 Tax=Marinospirillum alkaliphilum DSM 21637 TaxID=1122209 RepID=A0A1K1YDQ1_9GAMM|nr:proton-conducting transporter membrane subunit [Marinospirillum alkaliphilum]SFX59870.1 Formate hydrogenlyase subunit 3/Multisubunit Na+/H+ antiporter, MnhD subunit [Marinospirillum alkaliphilum DSM 21637]